MSWADIFLIFVFISFTHADIDDCTYQYKYSCDNGNNMQQLNATQPLNCSLDNIPDSTKYALILSPNGLSATGILKVNLYLPNVSCRYKVALLVNETIKNEDECKKYNFTNYDENEIHSLDQTICITEYDNSSVIETNSMNCKEEDISIYFEHVFTGCYALRYVIDDNYVIRSRKYISTTYQRMEVEEPTFRCDYDNRKVENESRDLVTFNFRISILPGSTSMSLKLIPLSSEDENKEDACIKYSKTPQYAWGLSLSGSNNQIEPIKGCNVKKNRLDNGRITEDADCSFSLPVPYNESYCFLITLVDSRCIRHTTWSPPPKDEFTIPCTWIPKCSKVSKPISGKENAGDPDDKKVVLADIAVLLPITAGIIVLIIVISGAILIIYRSRARILREDLNFKITLRQLKDANNIEVDGIDADEDHAKAIVLLYARGSKPFMAFMLHFREILECYCGCHVYDWYAACEWDSVARIGACEWADSLIKHDYNRVVWIDTPTARSLINIQYMESKSPNDEHLNMDLINDFRDLAFPSVLEFAKRNVANIKLQYDKHFVVRIEGFNHDNLSEDPFGNLSPHARFLIPYHLKELCSHLSSKRSESKNDALSSEQIQLKERLKKMKSHF